MTLTPEPAISEEAWEAAGRCTENVHQRNVIASAPTTAQRAGVISFAPALPFTAQVTERERLLLAARKFAEGTTTTHTADALVSGLAAEVERLESTVKALRDDHLGRPWRDPGEPCADVLSDRGEGT